MKRLERLLVQIDQGLGAACLRLVAGFLLVPAWRGVGGTPDAGWTVVPFFLALLAAFRLVPAGLRKVLPLSNSAKAIWVERRRLAKRFDSYQWRKLFWIGIGLTLYTLLSSQRFVAQLTLTLVCLVSGVLGLMVWRHRAAELESDARLHEAGVTLANKASV